MCHSGELILDDEWSMYSRYTRYSMSNDVHDERVLGVNYYIR